jgi:ComF family protein
VFDGITKFILDTLFPISCLACGKTDEWLCDECLTKIPPKTSQVCPLCEKKITPDGRICFDCRRKSKLDGLLVAASYKNNVISGSVHNYKYRFVEDLHIPLGKILIRAFLNSELSLPDLIVPVPLHPRRLRYRGFNQAELLADYLSDNLSPGFSIPAAGSLIIRRRYTAPQMKIKNYSLRQKNLEGAFEVAKKSDRNKMQPLENKKILLVDDIATTGATLFECARVLKAAGAKEVLAIVIARQEVSPPS